MSALLDAQIRFDRDVARLVLHFAEARPTWGLRTAEKGVQQKRKVACNGFDALVADKVHRARSLHYEGLACDINLTVDGKYITSGDHPAWKELHAYWESLHPLNRKPVKDDANHFSTVADEFDPRA
jgi:hypothetical protein